MKELISIYLDVGINVLWCRGTKPAGVDYVALRKKYGQKLALIGGIDIECLTEGKRQSKPKYTLRFHLSSLQEDTFLC